MATLEIFPKYPPPSDSSNFIAYLSVILEIMEHSKEAHDPYHMVVVRSCPTDAPLWAMLALVTFLLSHHNGCATAPLQNILCSIGLCPGTNWHTFSLGDVKKHLFTPDRAPNDSSKENFHPSVACQMVLLREAEVKGYSQQRGWLEGRYITANLIPQVIHESRICGISPPVYSELHQTVSFPPPNYLWHYINGTPESCTFHKLRGTFKFNELSQA